MFDERGNAVLRLDKTGAVLSEHKYQAYGKETTTRTAASGAASDPWGFGAQYGYYTDHETGFVYCTFRYYDPATGRWLSPDPIGLGGGQQNLYAYCGGNPIMGIDPLGLRLYFGTVYNAKGELIAFTSEQKKEIIKLLEQIRDQGGDVGKKMVNEMCSSQTDYVIRPTDDAPVSSLRNYPPISGPNSSFINLNIPKKYQVKTDRGYEHPKNVIVLAHELGHLRLQTTDEENVINTIENPIRESLKLSRRLIRTKDDPIRWYPDTPRKPSVSGSSEKELIIFK